MLGALLGCEEHPNDNPLVPDTVVDFNYIAIFPLSSHFEMLLRHLPKVDRLFVQLTPRPGNRILEEEDEMKHIDPADLWMERNTSYSSLVRELTFDSAGVGHSVNWSSLKVFESGDAADKEAWEMAVQFVERSGASGWKVEREGVFAKYDEEGNAPVTEREVDGHVGATTSLEGPLLSVQPVSLPPYRFAFSDISILSAM